MREACAAALLVLAVAGGCGGGGEEGTKPLERTGEIVRVGSASLTGEDIKQLMSADEGIPPTFEERQEFVRRWVDTQVLYQEALRRGLKDDARIKARIKALEEEYLADFLLFTELGKRAAVSEEEIEAYYAEHEIEYRYEYRVSQILVNTPEEAERARTLLASRTFAWIANRYSVDANAKRGGDLGYLTKGNMIPALETVVFSMKPGDVSGVVQSDFGYHIFKLEDVREALVPIGLDDVREQIMNTLMIAKRTNAYRDLIDSLTARANVDYRDESYLRPPAAPAPVDTLEMSEDYDTTGTP